MAYEELKESVVALNESQVPLENRWMMTPDGQAVQLTDANGLSIVEKQQ